jgi:hypothetical protein
MITRTYKKTDKIEPLLLYLGACSVKEYKCKNIIDSWSDCEKPSDLIWFLSHLSNIGSYPKIEYILLFLIDELYRIENRKVPYIPMIIETMEKLHSFVLDQTNKLPKISIDPLLHVLDYRFKWIESLIVDVESLIMSYEGKLLLHPAGVSDLMFTILGIEENIVTEEIDFKYEALSRIRRKFSIPEEFRVDIDEEFISIIHTTQVRELYIL